MELARPFIQLPYTFDAERLGAEAASFGAEAWMPHPSGMAGNSALPLISQGGGRNDEFEGTMSPTEHLERSPYLQQVIASFGEVIGRARLMKLESGSEVATHVDFNYHWRSRVRIHVPILTEPEVKFTCANQTLHMAAGECWTFNSWRRHRVINAGRHARIHLVIDTAGSSRFWKMVEDMAQYDPIADRSAILDRVRLIPFEPGTQAKPLTEKYNVTPVMAPGEMDALISELIADFRSHPQNDPALVQAYATLLKNLGHDWREVWALHGYQPSGFPLFRALLDKVRSQLHPNRRALVTASNQVGVNPIIVQRILRAALAPGVTAQFSTSNR